MDLPTADELTPSQEAALLALQHHIGTSDEDTAAGASLPSMRDVSMAESDSVLASPQGMADARPPSTIAPIAPPPPIKTDLSRPLGYSPPAMTKPVDTELASAQADAKARRGMAGLGQAVSDYASRPNYLADYAMSLKGRAPEPQAKSNIWQNYGAEGDRAISDLMERRKSEAAMGAQQGAAAKAAADKDPNSSKANLFRSVVTKYSPGLSDALAGKSWEDMSMLAPDLAKMIEQQGSDERSKTALTAKQLEDKKRDDDKKATDAESLRRFDITSKNSSDNAKATQDIAKASLGLRYDEAATKKAEAEAKAKAAEEAKVVTAETSKIPFSAGGGTFVPREGTKPDEATVRKAREDAASYNDSLAGIAGLKKALGEWATNPSSTTRDRVIAEVRSTSAAINKAQGQGAMSIDEAKQNTNALGADLVSSAGVQAFIDRLMGEPPENIVPVITRRAEAVEGQMKAQSAAHMNSYNYDFTPGSPAAKGKTVSLKGKTYRETGDPAHPLEEVD